MAQINQSSFLLMSKFIWFLRGHKKLTGFIIFLAVVTAIRLVNGQAAFFPRPNGPGSDAVYVQLGQAYYGNMRELGLYYGTLTAPNRFTLAPKVGGEIKRIMVDIGDRLTNGQLVAALDDDEFVLARDRASLSVRLAEAQFNEAEANLKLAQNDMARQTALTQKSIVTQSEFETVENRLLQANARLAVASSQLDSASNQLADAALRLSYTQLMAAWPESNLPPETESYRYVGARLVDEGQLVTANTPILELVSLDPLLVVVDVIEKDYPKIVPGLEANIRTEAFPGQDFKAKVIRVAPVLSADSRQARVEMEVANPGLLLKPGMFAEVVYVFNEHKDVWSVDYDVPFRRSEGYVIFVADPQTGTVKQIPVELGLMDNGRVELIGVPAIDGPIVTLGQHLLQDGQPYKVPGESAEPVGRPS
ncbi:MAG: efflux RND transporter periplasmic adaptor subunit [Deltaproteobacteria bacterium]|nr:efflux RND transporter periplasmic adaptor subunit [Deltaproteobacteria bacterium]